MGYLLCEFILFNYLCILMGMFIPGGKGKEEKVNHNVCEVGWMYNMYDFYFLLFGLSVVSEVFFTVNIYYVYDILYSYLLLTSYML